MYKLFFIVVCLLLNSNVAEAKFDEDLQKRCINIVNYKLAGDVGSLIHYFYPKTGNNPKFVKFYEKKQIKDARRHAEKGLLIACLSSTLTSYLIQQATASMPDLILLSNAQF
jgi:hypothetical protein